MCVYSFLIFHRTIRFQTFGEKKFGEKLGSGVGYFMTDTSAIFISSNQEHDESGETGHECKFKNILTLIGNAGENFYQLAFGGFEVSCKTKCC